MKKLIIMSSMLMISAVGFAQSSDDTDNREKMSFGLKGGLNYSNVYDEKGDQFNADAKFGLAAGLFVEVPIGKYLGFHPEMMVSQKGFQATGYMLGAPYSYTRTTTFIDFPLMFALKPSEFFTIVAGPQYSYLVKQNDVFISSVYSYAQEEEFNNDNINKNIFGVAGGIDINLKHIVLGSRVSWDITHNNGDGTSESPRYKNVLFQGTIGFKFY